MPKIDRVDSFFCPLNDQEYVNFLRSELKSFRNYVAISKKYHGNMDSVSDAMELQFSVACLTNVVSLYNRYEK